MSWWKDEANLFMRERRQNEADETGTPPGDEVRRAIMFAREDVSLVVSYLAAANRQLSTIKNILTVLLILVALPYLLALARLLRP